MSDISISDPTLPLVRKLGVFIRLSDKELSMLRELGSELNEFEQDTNFVTVGEPLSNVYLLEKGWAIRHKLTLAGERMITNFVLPGDFFCVNAPLFDVSDHSVTAVTSVTVAKISIEKFIDAMKVSPRIALAIAWCAAKEESLIEEHLVNTNKRTAYARLAHLLIELWRRLEIRKLTDGGRFPLPVTQLDLADSLGLSIWYVNRLIQKMRRDRLVSIDARAPRQVQIANPRGLAKAAGFESEYLHYTEVPARTARIFGSKSGRHKSD